MHRGRWIGRETEASALAAAFAAEASVVTLCGPGGVGKSRLLRRFTDDLVAKGVTITAVDAHGVAGDEAFWALMAQRCGLSSAAGGAPIEERVCQSIAARPDAVLSIDGAEGVLEALRSLISAMAERGADVRFLVATREATAHEGECCIRVPPLEPADACALFVARIEEGGLALPADAVTSIPRLVSQLDGLPLSIELAAGRAHVMSIGELEARMRDRFATLAAGPTLSLRGSIEWSWQLLPEEDRRALRVCALFSGAFSLRAFEAVADSNAATPAVERLTRLVNRSLVSSRAELDEYARFRLLDSVREFVLDAMPAVDSDVARFAEHHAAIAAKLLAAQDTPDAIEARRVGRRELANLSCAARYTEDPREAADLLCAIAWTAEQEGIAPRLLALWDDHVVWHCASPERVLRARVAFAKLLRFGRGVGDALAALHALEEDAAAVSPAIHAEWLYALSTVSTLAGRPADGLASGERALELTEANGLTVLSARIQLNMSSSLWHLGRAAEATRPARLAFERGAEHGVADLEALAALLLGELALDSGDLAESEAMCTRARDAARRAGLPRTTAFATQRLALALFERGELDVARGLAVESEESLGALGLPLRVVESLSARALIALAAGDPSAAEAACVRALEIGGSSMFPLLRAQIGLLRAIARGRSGDRSGATTLLDELESGLTDAARSAIAEPTQLARVAAGIASLGDDQPLDPTKGGFNRRAFARFAAATTPAPVAASGPVLAIANDGTWFRIDDGDRVDLSTRRPLSALLRALADARLRAPGAPLTMDELIAAAWPGARPIAQSGPNRVYDAIRSLRRLGLKAHLLRLDSGYMLHPSLAVQLEPEA